jgi:hypothetical protein
MIAFFSYFQSFVAVRNFFRICERMFVVWMHTSSPICYALTILTLRWRLFIDTIISIILLHDNFLTASLFFPFSFFVFFFLPFVYRSQIFDRGQTYREIWSSCLLYYQHRQSVSCLVNLQSEKNIRAFCSQVSLIELENKMIKKLYMANHTL